MAFDFKSGPFDLTYDGNPLGTTEGTSFTQRVARSAEEIRSDQFADVILALINRGGAVYLNMILLEAGKAAVQSLAWPLGTTPGQLDPSGANGLGCIQGGTPKALVATSKGCATTSGSNTVRTYHNVVVAPGFTIEENFGSRLRRLPLMLLALPIDNSGTFKIFTDSTP